MIIEPFILYFIFAIIVSPFLLAILYPLAIQYERGGGWYIVVPFFTLPAFIIDVFMNITFITIIYWELPFKYNQYIGKREITYSDRLERLVNEPDNELYYESVIIAKWLNRIAPSKKHIRNLQEQL